jgi:hypothetical protein
MLLLVSEWADAQNPERLTSLISHDRQRKVSEKTLLAAFQGTEALALTLEANSLVSWTTRTRA